MDFADIQQTWNQQPSPRLSLGEDALNALVRKRLARLAKSERGLIVLFCCSAVVSLAWLTFWGILFGRKGVAGLQAADMYPPPGLLFVPLYLAAVSLTVLFRIARLRHSHSRYGESLRGHLRSSLSQIRHRISFWRILPWAFVTGELISVACILANPAFNYLAQLPPALRVMVFIPDLVVFCGLLWWSQRTIRRRYRPQLEELESIYDRLDNDRPPPIRRKPGVRFVFAVVKWSALSMGLFLTVIAGSFAWQYFHALPLPVARDLPPPDVGIVDLRFKERIDDARAVLERSKNRFHAPAWSICVGVDDRLVWSEAFGYADLEARQPATVSSLFPIGSLSKPLTAVAAVRLAEMGTLDLDADVRTYVPSFPEHERPITLRQLLAHRSGIRHYRPVLQWSPHFVTDDSWSDREFATLEESLVLFSGDPLQFEPGTRYQYSTFGYTLAGAAMANAAHKPFIELMDVLLFQNVGMTSTRPDFSNPIADGRVKSYDKVLIGNRVSRAPTTNDSYKWPGGGFLSTPTDLVRFGLALLNDRIISRESFEAMLEPLSEYENSPFPQFHALGWNFYPRDGGRRRIVNHGGSPVGGQACLVLIPETGVVVAITSNAYIYGSLPLKSTAAQIAEIFADPADVEPAVNATTP